MKVKDTVVHKTSKYDAKIIKIYKNGNAILRLLPTERTKKAFGSIEIDLIKVTNIYKWFILSYEPVR